jgi:hypothetical protein
MLQDPVREFVRQSAVGESMQRMLREGVPEIGWEGDPFLTLCWNKTALRWEVWDERQEKPYCVYRSRHFASHDEIPDIFQLCAHLRDHDLRKNDVVARVDKHNAAVEKALNERRHGEQVEALMKVAFYIGKEVGHHY